MTEKIKWYKEVLELEPNSKVFFPLARLLAKDGETCEAIDILEKGLKRHPEYLEARLYLIELLHSAGGDDACDAQVEELSKMFASYAGFWQAWAACLAHKPQDADTASILRFLAANFISGPLQLHDVIDRGLASIIQDAKSVRPALQKGQGELAATVSHDEPEELELSEPSEDGADLPVVEELAEMAAEAKVTEPSAGEEAVAPMAEAVPEAEELELPEPSDDGADLPVVEELAEMAAEVKATEPSAGEEAVAPMAEAGPEAEELELPEPSDDGADLPVVEDPVEMAANLEAAVEEIAASVFAETGQASDNVEIRVEAEEQEAEIVAQEEMVGSANKTDTLLPTDEECALSGMIDDLSAQAQDLKADADNNIHAAKKKADEPVCQPKISPAVFGFNPTQASQCLGDEQFSLRTRSMAEVLAEQGDLEGALDIYQELAQAASDPDEKEDINRRLATLRGRLKNEKPLSPFMAQPHDDTSSNKEKLINMLETLAQRVEARARN